MSKEEKEQYSTNSNLFIDSIDVVIIIIFFNIINLLNMLKIPFLSFFLKKKMNV